MRDDTSRWTAFGPVPETLTAKGVSLAPVTVRRQTLVSGPAVLDAPPLPVSGWSDIVTAASYAVAMRRDRILMVDGPVLPEGWHEDRRLAVSEASDCFTVLELTGQMAFAVLKRGAELRLDQPSRSVVRHLFGIEVLLYRYGAADGFRLHVASGQTEALIGNFRAVLRTLR